MNFLDMYTKGEKNLILVGLPHSGKTTFISALWYFVESHELDSALKITSLPAERSYLHDLRSTWLECKDFERTKTNLKFPINLDIADSRTKETYRLIFPDVSGEMYSMHFETRAIEKDYVEHLKRCTGILLFINPDFIQQPVLISDAEEVLGNETQSLNQAKPWSHKDAPTQVVLVDLMQILCEFIDAPFKVALIVSAWDIIKNMQDQLYQKMQPAEYVKRQMPLLDQYFKTNQYQFSYRAFGISAQGAPYGDDNSKLQAMLKQSKRIIVQDGKNLSHDLCLPLKWLLNEE